MIDLSALTSTVNDLSNIILVNPQKDAGITAQDSADPSFLFHYAGDEVFNLTSDVTDHYVEDNSAINDHVALKPETFTVTGYIGELNNVTPKALEAVKEVADRLGGLSSFAPALSASAIIAYNTAQQLYTAGDNAQKAAVSSFSSIVFGASNVQTKQQLAFNQFYGWWKARKLFTVQTPWNILKDLVIMNLRATQDESSKVVTEFQITFKQIRFASTSVTTAKVGAGRNGLQAAKEVNLGTGQPISSDDVSTKLK